MSVPTRSRARMAARQVRHITMANSSSSRPEPTRPDLLADGREDEVGALLGDVREVGLGPLADALAGQPPSPMAILDSARLYSLAPAAERSRAALGWSGLLTNDVSRCLLVALQDPEVDDADAEDDGDHGPAGPDGGRRPRRSAAPRPARRPAPGPCRGRAACRSGRRGWRTGPAPRPGPQAVRPALGRRAVAGQGHDQARSWRTRTAPAGRSRPGTRPGRPCSCGRRRRPPAA